MKNLIYFVQLAVLLTGCKPYSIDEIRILRASSPVKQFFFVSKITVQEYSSDGVPLQYKEDTIVICFPKTNPENLAENNVEKFKKENPECKIYDKQFEPQKVIYLDKENEFYFWVISEPQCETPQFATCPLKFKPNGTYQIHNLMYNGNPGYAIFVKVNADGTYKTIHYESNGKFPADSYRLI